MSFELTKIVINSHAQLNIRERMMLIVLADMTDSKGYCFPSINTLSRKASCSRSAVIRVTKTLEKSGFITVFRQKLKSNTYRITTKIQQKRDILDEYTDESGDSVTVMPSVPQTPPKCPPDTPPSVPQTRGYVPPDTLISNIINKGINKKELIRQDRVSPSTCNLQKREIKKRVEGKEKGKRDLGNTTTDNVEVFFNIKNKSEGKTMNVVDSIKSAKDGTGMKQPKNKSPQSIWLRQVSDWRQENDVKDVLITMTVIDIAKLNTLRKKLKENFPNVIENCVTHWEDFVSYNNKATGGYTTPEQPDIGYMTKYVNQGLTFDPTKVEDFSNFGNKALLD